MGSSKERPDLSEAFTGQESGYRVPISDCQTKEGNARPNMLRLITRLWTSRCFMMHTKTNSLCLTMGLV